MLISKPHKKIVLNSRNPNKLLTTIPTAKSFIYKNTELVAVPHKMDETQVLRNMGYKVPSPVEYQYNWSGQYTPFEAQLETTAFLTLNNRAFCLNDMGCVDADTEYLSPTGWVRIADYQSGQVAQYHPDTQLIEFVDPLEFVKKPCTDMLRIKSMYGLDQMLSPEHRVLLATRDGRRLETVQAEELYARQEYWHQTGKGIKKAGRIGYTKAAIPATFKACGGSGVKLSDAQLRVQIAVIADGYFPNKSNRCVVRLLKPRKIERLRKLLLDAGIVYRDVSCKPDGYRHISFQAPLRLKHFDNSFWQATPDQLRVVTSEVLHWDGCTKGGRLTFTTLNDATADFVQYAFAGTGQVARKCVKRRLRPDGSIMHEITLTIRKDGRPLGLAATSGTGARYRNITPTVSPDGFKYCFMVPSTYLLFRRNGCVFASGNTGKTLATLWAYDYLRDQGRVNKMLVISPLSTLERTWADEIFRHFPHLSWAVVYGSREKRMRMLKSDVDIYLINHDGIKVLEKELMARPDIDIVVIDEIASFRNAQTSRWKTLQRITAARKRVWGLTGTPTPNAPTDAWAQCRLICPDRVPKYAGAFRDQTMRQVSAFKWVPRDTAVDIVANAMQPSIRYSRDQCVDLPPCVYVTRQVEMSVEQKKAYKEMLTTLFTEMQQGQVLAVNEAVKMQKLVQIASGVVYARDGTHVELPSQARIQETIDIIEQSNSKTIVFVPYKGVLHYVAKELGKRFSVAVINGDTPKGARDIIFKDFQHSPHPQVLVAQPYTMGHGLTLTAASTVVWYSAITSAEIYNQANARVSRPGQTHGQVIAHIEGSAVERRLYQNLQTRKSLEGILLEVLQDQEDL